jgi:Skp family chaperone for outer membrane proteins
MKSRIFMYLFIFTALIALYQFKSASNYVTNTQNALQKYQDREGELEKLQQEYKKLEEKHQRMLDSLSQLNRSEKF